ncbi:MAG: hypothetical protein K6F00_04390 [Lachnospiraceae bacterium]|nr:hypothetical protein [Lachnospiraceae bacterium]
MHSVIASMLLVPILAVASLGAPETQMNMDYSGRVDMYSGEPLQEGSGDGSTLGGTVVALQDGGSYNREDHTFAYTPNGSSLSVRSNVANNMVTTDPVSIVADEGLEIELYKNSKPQTDLDLTSISTPGQYTVVANGAETSDQVMAFTIVTRNTGVIDRYVLPSGFVVSEVIFGGSILTDISVSEVDLTNEGEYDIKYRCKATGVDYQLKLDIDHTAPEYNLLGVKNGIARGPVTVDGITGDDEVSLKYNGNEVGMPLGGIIRNVGRYSITVTDKAGNYKSEDFTVRMYLNYQGIIFIAIILGLIIAMIAFMVLSRKNMRIR